MLGDVFGYIEYCENIRLLGPLKLFNLSHHQIKYAKHEATNAHYANIIIVRILNRTVQLSVHSDQVKLFEIISNFELSSASFRMPLVPPVPLVPYNVIIQEAHMNMEVMQRRYGRGAIHPEVALSYVRIGEAFFLCEEYFDALRWFKRALAIYLEYYKNQAGYVPQVAHVYNHVGNTFVEMERYAKAHQNFVNALNIFRAAYGQLVNHDNIAVTYCFMAEGLRKQSKLEEAFHYNAESLAMLESIHGENEKHELIAKAQLYVGLTLRDQCKYEKADRQLKSANYKFRHVYASYYLKSPDAMQITNVAKLFMARGDIQAALGKFWDARYRYNHANSACKTFWGDDEETSHVFYAEIFEKVGCLNLLSLGTKDAMVDFEEAYNLRSEFYNDEQNHAGIAKSYIYVGHAHKLRFEYDRAVDNYQHAFDIYEATYSEDAHSSHPNLARCQNLIGEANMMRANFAEALQRHHDALYILQDFFGTNTNHPDIALTYRHIAAVHLALGNYDKAHEFNHTSLTMNKAIHNGSIEHLSIVENYLAFGRVYFGQGELHQAMEYFQKGIMITDCIFPEGTIQQIIIELKLNVGHVHQRNRDIERALDTYVDALRMAEALYVRRPHHPTIAKCYHGIGDVYVEADNFEEALKYYAKAGNTYDYFHSAEDMTFHGCRNPGKSFLLMDTALVYALDFEYEKAKGLLNDADTMHRLTYGILNTPIKGNLAKMQGDVFSALGDPRTACEKYTLSLHVRESLYGKGADHPDVAQSCYYVGVEKGALFHYQDSLDFHLRALAIRETVHKGMNHLDLAASYNGVGCAYMHMKNSAKALEYFHKELAMKIQIFSPNEGTSVDIAKCYTALGGFHDERHQFAEAIEYHKKALAIYESLNYESSITITLDDIGMVNMHSGQWDEAEDYHKRSLERKEEQLAQARAETSGESSEGEKRPMIKASQPIESSGKGKGPVKKSSEAVEEHLQHLHYPEIAMSHCFLGNVYFDNAISPHHGEPVDARRHPKYEKAYHSYSEALRMLTVAHPTNKHPDIADVHNNLGLVLQSEAMQSHDSAHSDNCELALKHHNDALEIRQGLFDEPHAEIALSYHNIGKCYHYRGDYDTALDYYERSLRSYHALFGEDAHQISIAEVYSSLGTMYYQVDELDSALDSYEKAHTIFSALHDSSNPSNVQLAVSLKNLGNVYDRMGNQKEARKAKEQAHKILEERLGPQAGSEKHGCNIM